LNAWDSVITPPLAGRSSAKPRSTGYTMVLDKGLGLHATDDLLSLAGAYIDAVKLTFGTSALYPEALLRAKIERIRAANCDVYPGGTLLEIAVIQGVYDQYLRRARELGFTAIEVSDGTIELAVALRREVISRAVDAGFKVISEVGKKDPKEEIAIGLMHEEIALDRSLGAFKVIVEARESGRGVGIFDAAGNVEVDELDQIVKGVDDPNALIWEAPIKNQQVYLIGRFGSDVNLGNIPTDEVIALEALRVGLRGDTLKLALKIGTWKG
jgi:phosphosulfolactate synthase